MFFKIDLRAVLIPKTFFSLLGFASSLALDTIPPFPLYMACAPGGKLYIYVKSKPN